MRNNLRFFCIIRSLDDKKFPKKSYTQLKNACEARGIEFITIESEKADFTDLPELGRGDMLYRISIDSRSARVFRHIINPETASFHIDSSKPAVSTNGWGSTLTHRQNNLPIIPTIIDLPRSRQLLDKYVKRLGGYPIVVKIEGGSHGVGVMRADSSEALYSLVDYLRSRTDADAALRQYIDFSAQARLIVLGDKVVESLDYTPPKGDFRSNVDSKPIVKGRKFSPEVERAAVEATRVIGYEFGGVDILIDRDGKNFYIAEVNFPCNFSRAYDITGKDIAGLMVDHLVKKAENK